MKRTTFRGFKQPKPVKLASIPHPTNTYEADSNRAKASEALRSRRCLALRYDGERRIVEVPTIGLTLKSRPAMAAFQVNNDSDPAAAADWRTFCFDECFEVALTDRPSSAPRPDYKKGDKRFMRIDTEV